MALATAKFMQLQIEEGLGLLYVACVPGGGLGHIIVALVEGDRALSVSMHALGTYIAVGTAPLWMFGLGHLVSPSIDFVSRLYEFEVWLGASAGAHILGALLNHFRPHCAEAMLNWLIKPFLLLFVLVFFTIGMYINIYMFNLEDYWLPIACGILPYSGYMMGSLVSFLTHQEEAYSKVIVTESTLSNCIIALVMIRFSLPQPDADLTSAIPMWVLFLSPLPFITAFLFRLFKRWVQERCRKRKEDKYRTFSIVSSLMNVTNVTNISAVTMTPRMNTPDSEDNDILIDEKITVL